MQKVRVTGEGEHPEQLSAIIFEDRAELTRARMAEDNRLIAVVDKISARRVAQLQNYDGNAPFSGPVEYPHASKLIIVVNPIAVCPY